MRSPDAHGEYVAEDYKEKNCIIIGNINSYIVCDIQ